MSTRRVLYHMVRADFLERGRRYSFLVMLGLVVWLGYASASGILQMTIPPDYVGEVNSPWVGALMSVTAAMLLGLFGFYLVKGSVSRDYETGVGQIIATTPLSRPLYALGKWLSNLVVLSVMILILMAAGFAMNLVVGKGPLDGWALVSPLLFLALPYMAVVAALAVVFEMIDWLRGGLGNIVYFVMFLVLTIPAVATRTYQPFLDWMGVRLVGDSIFQAAKLAFPETEYGFTFTVMNNITAPRRFLYDGIDWTASVILSRILFVLIAFGLALLASTLFDRFKSSKASPGRKKSDKTLTLAAASDPAHPAQTYLTSLHAARQFRFQALYVAELKMLLKGQRWWWYLISLASVVAQFTVSSETTPILLAVAWLWMILVLSGMGNREHQRNTREIVFSAPHPILNQIPALWLAAVTVIALAGSGALLHYVLVGETAHLLAWLGGVLFVPSLALALGELTQSRKPFEVVYVTWMYLILNETRALDFVGITPASPWQVYAALAFGLFALAALGRQLQLAGKSLSL